MCARFGNTLTSEELSLYFSVPGAVLRPRPEVRPTNQIPMVFQQDGVRVVDEARWWLVPSWWKKDLEELPSLFNARAEGIAEKPSFRSAFKHRRCLIPASCFYEWSGPKDAKTKHRIARVDGQPLALAGLWEEWRQPDGETLRSCTIITTTPNAVMEPIHNRMPVILGADAWDEWLLPHPQPTDLQHLLQPCPAEWIEARAE